MARLCEKRMILRRVSLKFENCIDFYVMIGKLSKYDCDLWDNSYSFWKKVVKAIIYVKIVFWPKIPWNTFYDHFVT